LEREAETEGNKKRATERDVAIEEEPNSRVTILSFVNE
jgi:hypothetical protein